MAEGRTIWRVTVSRGGRSWTYILLAREARAACLHWRSQGASARPSLHTRLP